LAIGRAAANHALCQTRSLTLTAWLVNAYYTGMSAAASDRLTAEERKDAIMTAALPLFATKGFDGVTTREVAEAACVSEALLYRHFENKRALYEAIQSTCVMQATADAQLVSSLPDNTSTLVVAAYLIMRNIQLGNLPGVTLQNEIPRLVLRSLLTDGEFAKDFLKSSAAPWIDKIERCVKAAIDSGDLVAEFRSARAGLWFAHHIAAAIVFHRLPGAPVLDYYDSGGDPEELFDDSVRFALRGLGLTPAALAAHYNPALFAAMSPR
jgi:AcrR family transcriptional regulator